MDVKFLYIYVFHFCQSMVWIVYTSKPKIIIPLGCYVLGVWVSFVLGGVNFSREKFTLGKILSEISGQYFY
jgi:hypothetical protein